MTCQVKGTKYLDTEKNMQQCSVCVNGRHEGGEYSSG